MNKKLLYLLLEATLVFPFFPARAQEGPIQNISARENLGLDGNWHYMVDPYLTGQSSRYYRNVRPGSKSDFVEYDFGASPSLEVPGDWNSQDPKLLYYEGMVWYQRDFKWHPRSGRRYFLHFGSVNYEAKVYLNGKMLGSHRGGFTPFQFEVTGRLNDGDNFIVVSVDNTRRKEFVPTLNYDWWNYGGITGDVNLVEMPETFIADYEVQLARGDTSLISGRVRLNGPRPSGPVQISIPAAGIRIRALAGADGNARFTDPVRGLELWSPAHPRLYRVQIMSAGDTVEDEIGFRTITARGRELLLNGKPIFLRGVCLHDENPLIPGRPRSGADERMLLGWAKSMDCNFIRLAHYPHNESEARIADQMGLLLWEEVPVYWDIDWTSDSTLESAEDQLGDLIGRDKNRASVIIWSIGNETPSIPPRDTFMAKLADLAHRLDPTRMVSAALLVHDQGNHTIAVDDPLGDLVDVVSFNEYYGWYVGGISDIGKYRFRIPYDKPALISEFGAGALGGYHADSLTRWSEEYQETFYREQLRMIGGISGLSGTCPWVLVDFRSPKRLNPEFQNGWNRKGLFTSTGQKKKAFFLMQAFYEQMEARHPDP